MSYKKIQIGSNIIENNNKKTKCMEEGNPFSVRKGLASLNMVFQEFRASLLDVRELLNYLITCI